jgi:hypothetical protein
LYDKRRLIDPQLLLKGKFPLPGFYIIGIIDSLAYSALPGGSDNTPLCKAAELPPGREDLGRWIQKSSFSPPPVPLRGRRFF